MLRVERLEVRYGGSIAVAGATFGAERARVTALLGANGAGKTTTMMAISGLLRASAGEIRFGEVPVTNLANDRLVARGVVQVPQGRQVFPQMSVADNLRLGAFLRRDRSVAADLDRTFSLFPRLAERRRQLAGTLSGGEQQMLAIGRALMARPKLLLLDEPSLGLAPVIVEGVYGVIRALAAEGLAILLAEQNVALALDVAAFGYVLENGRVVASGTASALADVDFVRRAYLGDAAQAPRHAPRCKENHER